MLRLVTPVKQVLRRHCRPFTTETSPDFKAESRSQAIDQDALNAWIAEPKKFTLADTLHAERVSDLLITIPSRDGSRKPFHEPKTGRRLAPGFEIAFFHFRTPESELREDGTDGRCMVSA